MRRRAIVIAVGVVALLASGPAALAAEVAVRVSPAKGGVRTHFRLRFSIPDATGTSEQVSVADYLLIHGRGHAGCLGSVELVLRAAAAHTRFRVTLNPAYENQKWCTGRFTGQLIERVSNLCGSGPMQIVCPTYMVAPRVLGRFHFTVTQPAH